MNENKELYLFMAPVGNADWKKVFLNICTSVTLPDDNYKSQRYIEDLYHFDLPKFHPNAAINLKDNTKFRIIIGYPTLPLNDKRNNNLVDYTPWSDQQHLYYEASWLCAKKCIEQHSDYTIILKNHVEDIENIPQIKRLIEMCEKYDNPYLIITDKDNLKYKDIYEHFIGE